MKNDLHFDKSKLLYTKAATPEKRKDVAMDFTIRVILCFIFPPLAVFDKGCGTICLIILLTAIGWIPGAVVALLLCLADNKKIGG